MFSNNNVWEGTEGQKDLLCMKSLNVECSKCNQKTTIRVADDDVVFENSTERKMGTEDMYSVNVVRKCKHCGIQWNEIHLFVYQCNQKVIGYE